MARRLVAVAVFALGCAVSARAAAQEPVAETAGPGFGQAHPFVLTLEHLGGFSYQHVKFEGQNDQHAIQAGLFTSFFSPVTPVARLGLHYFVAPSVSVGVLLGYIDNDEFGTTYLIGARVGYAASLSPSSAIWIRGGALYTQTKFSFGIASNKLHDVLTGGEILFVGKLTDNFGLMIGPMFELGVAGKESFEGGLGGLTVNQPDRKYDYYEAALTIGMLADF